MGGEGVLELFGGLVMRLGMMNLHKRFGMAVNLDAELLPTNVCHTYTRDVEPKQNVRKELVHLHDKRIIE